MAKRIDIQVRIPEKAKPKKKPPGNEVWPTKIADDDEVQTTLELRFFDGGTVWDGTQWVDAPLWNNDDQVELVWDWSKTWDSGDGPPFDDLETNSLYYIYGNTDSRVRASAVATQFGDTNPDRWVRKPLATRPAEWRTTGRQWSVGGTYQYLDPNTGETVVATDFAMFNPLVILKNSKDSEPKAIIDPDMYHEGIARRLKMKFPHQLDEIRELIYYCPMPTSERIGIEVRDQTKSFGHYLTSTGAYVYDWVDGPYFCFFDTTDQEQFKVTVDPSYEAEEFTTVGNLLQGGRKWDIFLMPRRWFFFVRYYQHENPVPYLDWLQRWQDPITRKHYVCFFWGRWPCDFSPSWGLQAAFTQTAPVDLVSFYNVPTTTPEFVWLETVTDAKEHAYQAGLVQTEIDKIEIGGTTANTHCVWSDHEDFMRIGDVGVLLGKLDGIKNDQLLQPPWTYGDTKTYEVRIEDPDADGYGMKRLWSHIEQSAVWTGIIKPLRDSVIHKQDEITTDCSGPSAASRLTHIPFGVGVSPSQAGDLVAILKTGEKAYFVWRRTDEEFQERIVGNPDPETDLRGPLRFESNRDDGRLDHYSEQSNPVHGGWLATPHHYDADYADMFGGPIHGRVIDSVGRELDYEVGTAYAPPHDPPSASMGGQAVANETDGEIAMHAPVWIMASKERALGDVYFGPALVMDLDAATGDPIYAPGTEAGPAIDGRNGALRERAARGVFLVVEAWYNASYKSHSWLNGF